MINRLMARAHNKLVFQRRKRTLVRMLAEFLTGNKSFVDVGSGDGSIALLVKQSLGDAKVSGIDILVRPDTAIEVKEFDGKKIPHEDNFADAVTFVDVLHHTDNPDELLSEAARVARKCVVIKDHLSESRFDFAVLRFMDWVGNAPHGVVLPYNYAPRAEWERRFADAGLQIDAFTTDVPLYPWPFSMLFGRSLHFVARLTPAGETPSANPQES